MNWTKFFLLSLLTTMIGCSQTKHHQIAPEIKIETLLQSPETSIKSLKDFRGQVVVLEFWATWCHPCLELLPHMNKIIDSFQNQPVRFISITDEPRENVEAYLKKHLMKAWIGLDPNRELFEAYLVQGIPEVYVIDPYGRIWLKVHPSFLYKSDINNALKASPPPSDNAQKT